MEQKRIDFYKVVSEKRRQMLPIAKANASDKNKDKNGSCTNMLALTYRFIGISDYLVAQDVYSFRSNVANCAELKLNLFRRFMNGEKIDPSYVTMLSYKEVFDALAAGAFQLAINLADFMGGRDELEKKYDHPFDRAMGYAVKSLMQETFDGSDRSEFQIFLTQKHGDFLGYATVFDGIMSKNEEVVNKGLIAIAEGHFKQSKNGFFKGTDDEYLCVWGVGITRFAQHKGLKVKVNHELIPALLIIP